jgi:hypothetical protein
MPSPFSSKIVSPSKVRAVAQLRQENKTFKEIGIIYGRHRGWAQRLLEVYDGETGLRRQQPLKTGRPRVTNSAQDFVIETLALSSRKRKIKDITNTLREDLKMNVTRRIVNYRLQVLNSGLINRFYLSVD